MSVLSAPARRGAGGHLNNFDLIRLLAALQVTVVHTTAQFRLTGGGVALLDAALRLFPGVPVFFLISGFLISASYERGEPLGQYLRNRCLRIFPALWVCLVASIGLLVVDIATRNRVSAVASGPWLIWWFMQMSSLQHYAPDFLHGARLNVPLWTIPVEMEFYLLLPLCCRLARRLGGDGLLWAILTVSLVVHWVLFAPGYRRAVADYLFLLDTAVPYLWMFLTGVLIQRHWRPLRPFLAGQAHRWLLGYALFASALRLAGLPPGSIDFNALFLLPLAGVVMSCATTRPRLAGMLLQGNDISYGTYLYHPLVLALLLDLVNQPDALLGLLAILLSLILGGLSWFLVERPFLRHQRRMLRGWSTPLGAEACP